MIEVKGIGGNQYNRAFYTIEAKKDHFRLYGELVSRLQRDQTVSSDVGNQIRPVSMGDNQSG